MNKNFWLVISSIGLILIDQLIKWIIIFHPEIFAFKLKYLINNNFILGFGPSADLFFWFLMAIILIFAVITVNNLRQAISLFVMTSGAISNLIDRFIHGGVVDYLALGFVSKINFNLSDLYLIIGLFSYLYILGKNNEKQTNPKIFRHQ